MGELKMYQPTKGMSAADRTLEGYGAVITAWIHSIEDVITPFYTITDRTDGSGVTLHPVNPLINQHEQSIRAVQDNGLLYLRYWHLTNVDNATGIYTMMLLSDDPLVYVWSADDMVAFGCANAPMYMGCCHVTDFDGNEQDVLVGNSSTDTTTANSIYISRSNGVNPITIGTNGGLDTQYTATNTNYQNFCVKPYTMGKLGLINNHLYALDGGGELPSYRNIYTLNGETYTQIYDRVAWKL